MRYRVYYWALSDAYVSIIVKADDADQAIESAEKKEDFCQFHYIERLEEES